MENNKILVLLVSLLLLILPMIIINFVLSATNAPMYVWVAFWFLIPTLGVNFWLEWNS